MESAELEMHMGKQQSLKCPRKAPTIEWQLRRKEDIKKEASSKMQ